MKTITQNELAVTTHRNIGEPMDFNPDVIARIIDELFYEIEQQTDPCHALLIDGKWMVVKVGDS